MAFITLDYKSMALMRGVSVKVILPTDGMAGAVEPPYKTLYFLPGYSTTALELLTYLGFRAESELKGLAIVMPDGENFFYQDDADRQTFYSQFVGKELVEVTRNLLPLSKKREDTFIGGVSMGGYGAIYNGLKYYETFSKIAAFSPAADPHHLLTSLPAEAGFVPNQFESRFGSKEAYMNSLSYLPNAFTAVPDGMLPETWFCCGVEDRLVYPEVAMLEAFLQEKNMPHIYREGHGDHELYYWQRMMDAAFSFLAGIEEGTKSKLVIPEL